MDLYSIRQQIAMGKSIYDLPIRVTYYARVSTDEAEQLHSLSAQVKYYNDFIQSVENWTFVDGYIDEGISGTSTKKRESFLRMIDDGKLGKFDLIITKEISRFSRNTLDSIKYTQELLQAGVAVFFQSDNINTLQPDAELRLTIMSSIAQDEVRKLSERVRFGFKRSIEKGVVLGNNRIIGYKKDNGKLVVDEAEAKIVRRVFQLYTEHELGMRRIGQELAKEKLFNTNGEELGMTTIRRILTNPKYKGYYCGGKSHKIDYRSNQRKKLEQDEWVLYKDEENVPAIVSEEMWEQANRMLSKRSEEKKSGNSTSYQNKYAYSGLIFCGEHGTAYQRGLYRYVNSTREVWQCKVYKEKGKSECSAPAIYTDELDNVMREIIGEISLNKMDIVQRLIKIYSEDTTVTNIEQDKAKYQVQIDTLKKRKDKLLDLNIDGKISDDEFETRNKRFNDEIFECENKISALQESKEKALLLQKNLDMIERVILKEFDFSDGFSRQVLNSLVKKIVVHKNEDNNGVKLQIHLNLFEESRQYNIKRYKGVTSVCTPQHI